MNESLKTIFEYSKDLTKLIMTLSMSIFTITITFSSKFTANLPLSDKLYLAISWLAYVLSILAGIWTLYAMRGVLLDHASDLSKKKISKITIALRGFKIIIPTTLQILLFICGIVLTILFGINII